MEWFIELVKYATQGFWVFLGSYLIILAIAFTIANAIIKTLNLVLTFFTTLFRGYPPVVQKPEKKCECNSEKNK